MEASGKPNGGLYRLVLFFSFHVSHLLQIPFGTTLGLTCPTICSR
jgi:hypothetical protein